MVMMIYPQIRLMDGPLSEARSNRAAISQRMAQDLIRFEALGTRSDSLRSLFWTKDYQSVDIAVLVDEARAIAFQEIVAREMSKP